MRIPGPPLVGVAYSVPYVGLADRRLWITKAGAKRQFPVEDMVMVTADPRTNGVLRVDFVEGDPLVVMVVDDGGFRRRLEAELTALDRRLQMGAESALGIPDGSPDLAVRLEEARRHSNGSPGPATSDHAVTTVSDGVVVEEQLLLHEAQVDALRKLRKALLASQTADGPTGRGTLGRT